jgi:hypothetical protein
MSKIEVNQISSQCGSTLTIGQSGDSIQLACGATQTGFGRTGTVDWDTTAKTAGFTAVSGNGYFVNTTSGAITVTLPAGSAGDIISLADYAGTWQTNVVTVTPNGTDKIGGTNTNATLSTEGQSVTFVYVDDTEGWKNVQDSTSNVRGESFIVATGGTITCCGNYKIHTFTGPGTFCVSSLSNLPGNNVVDYLVIAGGGGGGAGHPVSGAAGSGAGAGGYRESSGTSTGSYTVSPLGACVSALPVTAIGYPIVVGGGGAGACSLAPAPGPTKASPGSNSSFSTITSTAGGYGGSRSWGFPDGSGTNTDGRSNGGPGGSGGGGNIYCYPSPSTPGSAGTGNTPPVSPPQGQNGGSYNPGGNGGVSGGGATGAGGTNNPIPSSASGGAGATSSINGTPTGRAGGGGGGQGNGGTGPGSATEGGGAGGSSSACVGSNGSNGTANTGGGAGGGGAPGANGGTGGSGIVIIRYKYQ